MNRVTLIGNLTQPPQQRQTNSDRTVVRMRLAVPRPRKNGQDQGADYVDVTAFGATADNCARYLDKGRKVAVDGRLHHSEWDGDDGHRQRLEVIANSVDFLSAPPRSDTPADEVAEDRARVAVGAGEDKEDIPF